MRLADTEQVWTLSGDLTPEVITQNIRSGQYGPVTDPTQYRFMPVEFRCTRELMNGRWAVKRRR